MQRAPEASQTELVAMRQALALAEGAGQRGEVPVGALALFEGRVVAQAANARELDRDPTAHAELIVLRLAARALGRWRLSGVSLVVTLEPCCMCAGAIVNARIDRLVVGAMDAKAGAAGSLMNLMDDARLNHCVPLVTGVLAEASTQLLRNFFVARRKAGPRPRAP